MKTTKVILLKNKNVFYVDKNGNIINAIVKKSIMVLKSGKAITELRIYKKDKQLIVTLEDLNSLFATKEAAQKHLSGEKNVNNRLEFVSMKVKHFNFHEPIEIKRLRNQQYLVGEETRAVFDTESQSVYVQYDLYNPITDKNVYCFSDEILR